MQNLSNVQHRHEVAYVMITCETGCEELVSHKIKEISGIKEIKNTVGNYDIVVKIESESTEQLRDLLSMKIRSTPMILTTTTLLCTDNAIHH